MQLAGFLMQEKCHRYAPLTLTRQGPVRTVGDHAFQTGFTPCRKKLGCSDAGQCGFTQGTAAVFGGDVHARKPLGGGAVDDRGFMTPAVHVAMFKHHQFEQGAGFL